MRRPDTREPTFRKERGLQALSVVLLYACFSALWILLSDKVVEGLIQEPGQRMVVSTVKGWLFVAVTSILLYLLLLPKGQDLSELYEPSSHPEKQRIAPWPAVVLLGVTVFGVAWLSIAGRFDAERETAGAQLRAVADAKAQQLWDWHQERMGNTLLVQNSPDLLEHWLHWHDTGATSHLFDLQQRLRLFVSSVHFSRAAVVDLDGHEVWYPAKPDTALDSQLREGVNAALESGLPQRVGPWLDASGTVRLAFLAPFALDGDHPAVVVLHVDPPIHFHPALQSWPVPHQSAESILFRQEGDELIALSPMRHAPDAVLRQRFPLNSDLPSARAVRGAANPGQLIEGTDYAGRRTLAVAQRVGMTDWWVLVKQDRDELMSDAVTAGLRIALIGLLAFFAMGVGVYLYVQRLELRRSSRHIELLESTRERLAESETRYRLLAENGTDVVWLLDLPTMRFVYFSPSIQKQRGYTVAEALQQSIDDMLTPESAALAHRLITERLAALKAGDESARTQTTEIEQLHRDGHTVFTEVVSTFITNARGETLQLQGVTRDITARKEAEAKITQLSQATEQSPAGVVITSLDNRIEYVNPAFERITGYSRDEVIGQNPRLLQSGKTPPEVYKTMWHSLQAGQTWTGELINRHRNGHEYVQNITVAPVRNAAGKVTHYLAVQLDITAQRHAEDMAHQLSWFDLLTGLPNRRHLLNELADALGADKRGHKLSALLLINIDRFKTLNDALGHAAGDRLLQRMSQRLSGLVPPGNMLAHLGGDEFALLMRSTETDESAFAADALRLAEVLHESLHQPFTLPDGNNVNVTVSVGITLLPHHYSDTPSEVLRRADTALNRAKHGGGGQTAFFDATMGQAVGQRFAIEQDLRRGMAAGELRLFLQPQVDAQGKVVSAEALVRWQHPERGLVAPALFIPVAEESGLIDQLGQWVLREVCQWLGLLHREGRRLPIAVNISPHQFHQGNFVSELLALLASTGAQPEDLILEITEGVVMEEIDDVIERMKALNQHGVRFSIDDFGTGYSSLSYLKDLPIHELKIDRSFVQDAPQDPSDAALVEAILSVARHLQLRVVAEGVEEPEQAAFFNRHPGVLMQGYLFGRPEPAGSVIERVTGVAEPQAPAPAAAPDQI
ncbi:putative bifunctional diguanylate cyclase/phosphodiesterase [Hydrogenophaga aquatica]